MPIIFNNKLVSKLTDDQVRELRRTRPHDPKERGAWYKAMATKFGVHGMQRGTTR